MPPGSSHPISNAVFHTLAPVWLAADRYAAYTRARKASPASVEDGLSIAMSTLADSERPIAGW